ncbi:hypothetical protein [Streptomyces nigrescens]|uniref:hypothetical protein n=1 Tax=Streptomyces nigrescens TaxID=1920 RepID=UPI0036F6FFC9
MTRTPQAGPRAEMALSLSNPACSEPEPRTTVNLADGPGSAAAAAADGPLIGLAAGDKAVSLGPAAGHTLAVAWPGMGSTTLLRSLGAQFAARGLRIDILDTQHQHTWAHDLDQVTVFEDADRIHRHLYRLADEVRDGTAAGPRVVLIESTPTTDELLKFRYHPRPGGLGLDALTTVLAGGQLVGIRVVMACRDVPEPFGHVVRDLFTTRLLAHPTPRTWHLAGRLPSQPLPLSSAGLPGRLHQITATGTTALQAAYLSDGDARTLAQHPCGQGGKPTRKTGRTRRSTQAGAAPSSFRLTGSDAHAPRWTPTGSTNEENHG